MGIIRDLFRVSTLGVFEQECHQVKQTSYAKRKAENELYFQLGRLKESIAQLKAKQDKEK